MRITGEGGTNQTYVSHVVGDLSTSDEKGDGCHPLVGAETGLARKVVEMAHQTRHEVCEAGIGALRVYTDCVWGDVVDGEVEKLGRSSPGPGGGNLCHDG